MNVGVGVSVGVGVGKVKLGVGVGGDVAVGVAVGVGVGVGGGTGGTAYGTVFMSILVTGCGSDSTMIVSVSRLRWAMTPEMPCTFEMLMVNPSSGAYSPWVVRIMASGRWGGVQHRSGRRSQSSSG